MTVKKAIAKKQPAKRGRPKYGEIRIHPKTRIEQQVDSIPLTDMIADFPSVCGVETKRNSIGQNQLDLYTKLLSTLTRQVNADTFYH
ncbi:MAG: hypothetical protein K0U68_03470 [Gammaproteobacteria bacterium]|nr:hypothetical protein [Gammaproteobacteria bacterium]